MTATAPAPEEPTMRFDDDKARPTYLVRTPPAYVGQAVSYQVSDEFVDDAIREIRDLLPQGLEPLIGEITATSTDEIRREVDDYVEQTGGDALADYATRLAMNAHEQSTGTNIDGDALEVEDVDEPQFPENPDVGERVETAGRTYEFQSDGWHDVTDEPKPKAKKATAAKKTAAHAPDAAPKTETPPEQPAATGGGTEPSPQQ